MYPIMYNVKQYFDAPPPIDCVKTIREEFERIGLKDIIKAGSKVGITAGSRGVTNIPLIIKTIVEEVKRVGGRPFIIPSMGSHGGATSEGQTRVLYDLGINEEYVGAPINATMEVREVGRLENGMPVYVSRAALEADAVIVVGRVKPHTDFKDEIESGLMKMMVIGLGKQKGAQTIHAYAKEGYHKLLVPTARKIMEKAPIKLGVAIVENQYHETCLIKALKPEEIENEERKLLVKAKEWIMKIPFKELDVLIVEKIGKNISGTGMDPNVTGRFAWPDEKPPELPNIRFIAALDLTKETEGNAIGVGLADVITKRLFDKINFHDTYMNALTAGAIGLIGAKIPVIMPTDRDAIELLFRLSNKQINETKVMRIKNTLELGTFQASEALLDEIKANKKLEVVGEGEEMQFDILGNLI
ncbi:MAG: lactate racemase domain-containing protein [Nitrososphaeria archaeon]|nr:lactate racemase domain-containing protein [Nitrososphaeria archaeon]